MDTPRKYLAFDIETAALVPDAAPDWRAYRPLGITCAATLLCDEPSPRLWHGKTLQATPSARMVAEEVRQRVAYLGDMTAQGYCVLTWNGAAFDFEILAEESGAMDACKTLAMNHVDMMFHVFCRQGHPVALDKAAQGMGIQGKRQGMSGAMAPRLWAEGRYAEILAYVSQDAQVTLQLATVCEQRGAFCWTTQRGTRQRIDLSEGWQTVDEALRLPQPDTSWMRNPRSRAELLAWLGR